MLSTFEIVFIVVLLMGIGLMIWWTVLAYKYKSELTSFSYTRGANIDLKGSTNKNVLMSCEDDREICVWRATAICTGADMNNVESSPLEPIATGTTENSYGAFDKSTTIDMTKSMSVANGKENFLYNFNANNLTWPQGKTCPLTYNNTTGTGTRPQLIATYSCIPKGTQCNSYKPS